MNTTLPTFMGRDGVVVCGAGAAGLAASLSAARQGVNVDLIEARPRVGGTVTNALIHTLGGFFDSFGDLINGGLAEELAVDLNKADGSVRRRQIGRTYVLSAAPETYQAVVESKITSEPRISLFLNTRVTSVVVDDDRVVEVVAKGPRGAVRFLPKTVVDATGTAEVVRLINPNLLQDIQKPPAAGLIVRLRRVVPGSVDFPKGIAIVRAIRSAAENGELPVNCGKAWLDIGSYEDEVYLKLFVPLCENWRAEGAWHSTQRKALEARTAVVAFLKRRSEFAGAVLTQTGVLGIRDGGRIRGTYCLTKSDVLQAREFPDAACRCCWPIEYWDPSDGVSLEYLPERGCYEIPLRCLKVQGFENLWAAGKCLSADSHAQASARVVGCCWSMGEAVGRAATA
jgi:hypothetical protein